MKQRMGFSAENLLGRAAENSGRRFVHESDAAVAVQAIDAFRSGIENDEAFGAQAFALFFRGFSGHELPKLAAHAG
jgi:hypothetical protein